MSADFDTYVRERVAVAGQLRSDLARSCSDSQVDEIGARDNCAARAALNTVIEILAYTMPAHRTAPSDVWYEVGRREVALQIISAIEMSMYDPRAFPERYRREGSEES